MKSIIIDVVVIYIHEELMAINSKKSMRTEFAIHKEDYYE